MLYLFRYKPDAFSEFLTIPELLPCILLWNYNWFVFCKTFHFSYNSHRIIPSFERIFFFSIEEYFCINLFKFFVLYYIRLTKVFWIIFLMFCIILTNFASKLYIQLRVSANTFDSQLIVCLIRQSLQFFHSMISSFNDITLDFKREFIFLCLFP